MPGANFVPRRGRGRRAGCNRSSSSTLSRSSCFFLVGMDSFFSDFAAYAPWLCWGKRPPRGGDRDDDGIDHAPFPQLKAAMPLPILVWFFFSTYCVLSPWLTLTKNVSYSFMLRILSEAGQAKQVLAIVPLGQPASRAVWASHNGT